MKLPDNSRIAGKVYTKNVMDFENRIKSDFQNKNGQKWAVDVGVDINYPEAGIDEGYMVWTNEEILACFEPVVRRIIDLINNQISDILQKKERLKVLYGFAGQQEHHSRGSDIGFGCSEKLVLTTSLEYLVVRLVLAV